eukprot:UN03281
MQHFLWRMRRCYPINTFISDLDKIFNKKQVIR